MASETLQHSQSAPRYGFILRTRQDKTVRRHGSTLSVSRKGNLLLTVASMTVMLCLMLPATARQAYAHSAAASLSPSSEPQQSETPQSQGEPPQLELGKPIERELAGGQSHSYNITLTPGQYLYLVVDQRGIDVVVTIFAPDSKKLMEVDSPNGAEGPEPLSLIAEANGTHRIEVRSLEKTAAAGRYEARIETLRAATPQDKNRAAAVKLFREAEQLRRQATAQSTRAAIKKYEEALPLYRAAEDKPAEADMLNSIGSMHDNLGDKRKAIDYYNQALAISRAASDRPGEATALNNLGLAHDNLGEKQKALEYYSQALATKLAIGDRRGEAVVLNNIGLIYDFLDEKQKALDYFNQALRLRRAAGDRSGEAITLNNFGVTYNSMGEKQKALEFFNQSLTIRRATGDRRGEAVTLGNIASLYNSIGEKQKALEYHNLVLPIRRAMGDRRGEGITLNNMGMVYSDLGDKQKALDIYDQSLALRRAVGDRSGEATTLQNIGVTYADMGEAQKALDAYNQVLPIRRALGDRSGEAGSLHNIAMIYYSLGEREKARDLYNQALPLRRLANDRRGEANTLNSLGSIYDSLGDKQKALELLNQALELRRAVQDRMGEAATLYLIGSVHRSLGDKQKALDFYNQSLPISRAVGNRAGEANALNGIAAIYSSMGEKEKALELYNQALPMKRAFSDHAGEASTLYGIATVERDRGNFTIARSHIEAALKIIESLRTKVVSQELRASYFASVQKYYELYIDLLMKLHRLRGGKGLDGAALEASERARARSLLEMLAEAQADIRQGVEPGLLEREAASQRRLNARAEAQVRLLSGKHTEDQASAAAKEMEALTREYLEVEAQIRATSPRYAALTQPSPLSVKEIQRLVLDKNTLLLEYELGAERSYLWAVSRSSITSYELAGRPEIESAARRFYELLIEPNQQSKAAAEKRGLRVARASAQNNELAEAAARLSRLVLSPVVSRLGHRRLLVVADGALQYVPFGALPVPERWRLGTTRGRGDAETRRVDPVPPSPRRRVPASPRLRVVPLVIHHEIISLPSASTLAVLRRELAGRTPAPKTLAVIADPVFDSSDERVKKANTEKKTDTQPPDANRERGLFVKVQQAATEAGVADSALAIPRLPGTRMEAERILALTAESERMRALDFAASREAAASNKLSEYRYVHFATHGFLNAEHPELSGIVLSMIDEQGREQNGFLLAHEVYNLKLPAELVVLSACQTGLGKEIKGEGLVGLTRGLMYAGAPRVVVSLWSVDDEATSNLMVRLYRGMLKEKLRPAAALRAAQIAMWQQKRWRAPYYWAAFVLQGEWR